MVEISALKGTGTKEAAEAAVRMAGTGRPAQHLLFAPEIEDALKIIAGRIRGKVEEEHLRWYAVKLFERDAKAMEKISAASEPDAEITSAIEACEKKLDDDSESIITDQRYQKIGKMLAGGTRKKVQGQLSVSDKIDRIVTNRWLALPIFAIVMFLVYYVSVSTVGDILTGFTNDTLFGEWIAEPVREWLAAIGTQGLAGGVGRGRRHRRCGRGARVCSPDACAVLIPGRFGGLRLHGAHRLYYGSLVPQIWVFGQILYSHAHRLGVQRARHYGFPHH